MRKHPEKERKKKKTNCEGIYPRSSDESGGVAQFLVNGTLPTASCPLSLMEKGRHVLHGQAQNPGRRFAALPCAQGPGCARGLVPVVCLFTLSGSRLGP